MAVFNFNLWDNWVEAVHDMGYNIHTKDGRAYYINDEFINENFFCILWTPLNKLDSLHPEKRYDGNMEFTFKDVGTFENCHPIENLRTQCSMGMDFHWELSIKPSGSFWKGREDLDDITYDVFPENALKEVLENGFNMLQNATMSVDDIKECLKRMKDPKDLEEHITLAQLNIVEEA